MLRTSLKQADAESAPPQTSCTTCTERATTAKKAAGKAPPSRADELAANLKKTMCPKEKAFLADLKKRNVKVTLYDDIWFDDPYYDGTQWTTKRFDAGGTTSGTNIKMLTSGGTNNIASTLYHEGVHTGQPESMAWRDKEYDAYTKEAEFQLRHGIPVRDASWVKADGTLDTAPIHSFVDSNYPGVTAASDSGKPTAQPDQIIGKTDSGDTRLMRADGTEFSRAPKEGDSYPGPEQTKPSGGIPLDLAKVQCP